MKNHTTWNSAQT